MGGPTSQQVDCGGVSPGPWLCFFAQGSLLELTVEWSQPKHVQSPPTPARGNLPLCLRPRAPVTPRLPQVSAAHGREEAR